MKGFWEGKAVTKKTNIYMKGKTKQNKFDTNKMQPCNC